MTCKAAVVFESSYWCKDVPGNWKKVSYPSSGKARKKIQG